MKESIGLSIRISNAAAAEIGQTAERFNVPGNYKPVPSQKIHHRHPLLPLQLQLRHADIPIRVANRKYVFPSVSLHPGATSGANACAATPRGRSSTIFHPPVYAAGTGDNP